jgi:hypothetical protein
MRLEKPKQIHKDRYYVYLLIDPETEKPFYAGKGIRWRAWQHAKETYNNTSNKLKLKFIKNIQKSGKEPIVDIVYEGLSDDGAYLLEDYLIHLYGRLCDNSGILTNYLVGVKSPRFCGKNHPNFGKHMSESSKLKLSQTHKLRYKTVKHPRLGVTLDESTKRRISLSKKGKCLSEEHKHKISESLKSLQRKQTEYQKRRVSEARAKYFKISCPDGRLVEGYGLTEFCKNEHLSPSNLKVYGHSKGYKLIS